MELDDDIQHMLRVCTGDEAAFEVLHDRYQRRVLGFFWGLTRDAMAANELTQETFLRVWQVRKRYRASGPFAAYLFAIARMILLEQRRKAGRLARLGEKIAASTPGEYQAGFFSSPETFASATEAGDALHDAIAALPEEQRIAFLLHTVQGLSMDEVAAALDCPLNTARSRRILAVRKLRQTLSPYFASLTGRALVE